MRHPVSASAALIALATLAFGPSAGAAVTYAYAGTPEVWDLSFTYTSATAISQDSPAVVPCTDNRGDTSCTLSFYFAGTPSYLNPLDHSEIQQDDLHDAIDVVSTGGPGGGSSLGCCIAFSIAIDAGGLSRNGDTHDAYHQGLLTISGIPAASGAPEPASWALMILGFAAAGAAVRRRRPSLA